ncbi:HAD-IA family hydrolase [Streptomyces sp. CRN 30]|uniref:HAD-IA family hydrolase n=1 Tax=Streptomyces sp. CRN 30 TaxID=3075613 RepID=UPI002A808106|nr:HAD-IA family hydrolase [Streptomyces sp. CRN 30]
MTSYPRLAPDALLLDMDGTLVDSTVVVERTWRRFARRHGLDAEAILATAHGRRTAETVARYAPAGVDAAAETARLVAEEVEDVDGVVPVPGAPELLAALPDDRWAVVTSAGRELTHRRMTAAGLPLPPLLISADDVREGKPSPEGYLAAAAALGVPASETVVFEDAEAGLLAAAAAGATPVVVGAHRGPAAEGRLRVTDLREVTVTVTATGAGRGALHLSLSLALALSEPATRP